MSVISLLWVASGPLGAAEAERWYLAEVVVFEHRATTVMAGMLQNRAPQFAAANSAVELRGAENTGAPKAKATGETLGARPKLMAYQEVGDKYLSRAYHRLRTSPNYRVLLHKGWLFTPASGGRFVRLGVYRNGPYSAPLAPPPEAKQTGITRLRADAGDVQFLRALAPVVHGFVRARINHRLSVEVDFAWFPYGQGGARPFDRPPAPGDPSRGAGAAPSAKQDAHARIRQSHRIKLNETHYFGHPLFGVLVQVRQVEQT